LVYAAVLAGLFGVRLWFFYTKRAAAAPVVAASASQAT
jgi:hypothetical protein